jgi:hypothetical protein
VVIELNLSPLLYVLAMTANIPITIAAFTAVNFNLSTCT